MTVYIASYNIEVTVVCQNCGALVLDTDAHDDFHLTLVEDLTLLRKEADEAVPGPRTPPTR